MLRLPRTHDLRYFSHAASLFIPCSIFSFNVHCHSPFCRLIYSITPSLEHDIEAVTRILLSPTPHLRESLQQSDVFLSNDLVDGVLKRIRFCHGNPFRALEFFKITGSRKGFFHSQFSLDTLMFILGRNKNFNIIWDVLREIRYRDRSLISPRTADIVLSRIAKASSVRQTVESFQNFKRLASEFGTPYFNALLRTLCQTKSMKDAKHVYHSLKHDFRPNLQTFNILLAGITLPEEAEGFFSDMVAMGVRPDIVSYNSMIDMYCKRMMMKKAYEIAEKMRDEEIWPDVISYTSFIGGLGLVGQPDRAREVLKDMKEHGCYPDVASFNAVIKNFCVAKRFRDAFDVMDEMEAKGLNPNATSYNLFFRCFYRANDLVSCWGLYKRMMDAGCMPNSQTCMFLMKMFKRHDKVEMALRLWGDMVENDFGSYTLVSDVLFDLLCDMGRLDEAEACFLQMVDKGHKPSNVSFRRIKVLMELANRRDSLRELSDIMCTFGRHVLPQADGEEKTISEVRSSALVR